MNSVVIIYFIIVSIIVFIINFIIEITCEEIGNDNYLILTKMSL